MGLLLVVLVAPVRAAGPWYVLPGGSDSSSCLVPGSACATLTGALARASAGDTILVGVGTYTGTGTSIAEVTTPLTISGGWNADFSAQVGVSTLDGQDVRRGVNVAVCGAGDPGITVLERLKIVTCEPRPENT